MSKEHPIIFSAPMIRAILDGKKTQTRRVVKPQSMMLNGTYSLMEGLWYPTTPSGKIGLEPPVKCPYGQTGDRLWIRESFDVIDRGTRSGGTVPTIIYLADLSERTLDEAHSRAPKRFPSIYMPRKYSRLLLEICEVRVQRVQDISPYDCIAEGMDGRGMNPYVADCLRKGFASLWDNINAKRDFGWNVNPWVWAITFLRVEDK